MAIFRFKVIPVGRSAGRRATAAAAYRAGERLRDERTGKLYNYSRRKDVTHTEIFLPSHLAGRADAWAGHREKLWNTAEHTEKRANSRVAREYQLSLPHELNTAQRVSLARAFSRELAERYNIAVDLAVHLPRADGDPRNFHAHLLTTTREVTPRGLGAKTGLDLNGSERRRRELPGARQEIFALRERWAVLTNEALREANLDVRVDHRSLAAQGIDREPTPQFPAAALRMERRGVRSEVAERIREAYSRRVAARLQRAAQPAASPETGRPNGEARVQSKDAEEIRREAREAWRLLRTREAQGHTQGPEPAHEVEGGSREGDTAAATRGHDDDLAL